MQPFPGLERWSRQVTLPSSGIQIHLYDTGEAANPPVLLLHGLGDEADTWRHVLPLIADQHRVIAPDLPGFGRSEKSKRKHSIPFFAAALLELLDPLSIRRVVLVGHSMGAIIAQTIALEHPERVERLVLISGSLVSKDTPLNLGLLLFLTPVLGEGTYNRLRKDPHAASRTREPNYPRRADRHQGARDFLYQRVNERVWSDGQRQGFLSSLRSLAAWIPAAQKNLPARLSGWQIPTLVLWGENDRVSPVENARALVALLPSARLVVVPEAGHNLQQEKAGVVAEAIKQIAFREESF
jgi:pimeloyl-ACP methyl ester carboxylesterase